MLKGRGELDRNLGLGYGTIGEEECPIQWAGDTGIWLRGFFYLFRVLWGFPLYFSTLGFQDKP